MMHYTPVTNKYEFDWHQTEKRETVTDPSSDRTSRIRNPDTYMSCNISSVHYLRLPVHDNGRLNNYAPQHNTKINCPLKC